MGLELAEQFGWQLPDVIFYPTGGGTGLIGMWKMFVELEAMGWIDSKRPRMVAVQATGTAAIVKAWQEGEEHSPLWENAHTMAAGIRVPIAVGGFLILRAVRDSNGFAIAVEDEDIMQALTEVAQAEGLLLCQEGAATYAAYKQALAQGLVTREETVILFNCATGLKYPLEEAPQHLDRGGSQATQLATTRCYSASEWRSVAGENYAQASSFSVSASALTRESMSAFSITKGRPNWIVSPP